RATTRASGVVSGTSRRSVVASDGRQVNVAAAPASSTAVAMRRDFMRGYSAATRETETVASRLTPVGSLLDGSRDVRLTGRGPGCRSVDGCAFARPVVTQHEQLDS